jgi:hypothetical protein
MAIPAEIAHIVVGVVTSSRADRDDLRSTPHGSSLSLCGWRATKGKSVMVSPIEFYRATVVMLTGHMVPSLIVAPGEGAARCAEQRLAGHERASIGRGTGGREKAECPEADMGRIYACRRPYTHTHAAPVHGNPRRILEIQIWLWIWAEDFDMRPHDFCLFILYPRRAGISSGKFLHSRWMWANMDGAWPRVKGPIHRVPSRFAKGDLQDEPKLLAVIPGRLLGLQQDAVIEG